MEEITLGVRGWTWLVVSLSFAGYLVVLIRVRSRTAGSFYRPVRRVRPLAAGVAAASGWISAASYLSLGGALALSMPDGAVYLVGWTVGFALLALLVAPYLGRSGRHTIPQLVAERFRSPAAGAVAVACALLVTFTYLSAQLRGAALVLSRLAPLSLPQAVAAAAAVVLGYTALGRLRTLTGGQVAQYLVLAAAYFAVAGAALHALTGSVVPQVAPWARLGPAGALLLGQPAGLPLPEAVDRLGAALGLAPHGASGRGAVDGIASILALVAGTAALPHMVSRFLAMPRARDARASARWALAFIVLFYSAVPAVALCARAGLLASGAPLDPDLLVLAAPELLGLPPWVVAVGAAGALAAAVSAAAALVVALGAGVARDLLKGSLLPGLSEPAERRTFRATAAALTVVAAGLALRPPGTVVQTVGLAFGLAAASFFPALVAAVFWRRATRRGVLAGMIAGALFTVGYVHWFRFLRPDLDGPAHWWLGISPQGIGAVGAALGAAVLVGVSLLAPEAAPATERA
jgi:cation/acetate symporter